MMARDHSDNWLPAPVHNRGAIMFDLPVLDTRQ
jgi:hypothetical protein